MPTASPMALAEQLEPRRLLAANDPYNTYESPLLGNFVSAVPLEVIGGNTLPLRLRIRNPTQVRQEGLIDLTFVLANFVDRNTRPTATRFDPVLFQVKNVQLSVAPRGTQTFSYIGTIPNNLGAQRQYWVAVALDPGGRIDAGQGFGGTVGAAPTLYNPPFSDVTIGQFRISLRRVGGVVSGTLSGVARNFGNSAATGQLTYRVLTATRNTVGGDDRFITRDTIVLSGLRPRTGRASFSIPFDVPPELVGQRLYIRISLDRTALAFDLNADSNGEIFSRAPVRLG